jgi:N-acetyl-gamma-glutamyl-phosphate reductase
MKAKIFIDGREGTTGLQIYDRLAKRDDIELLLIDEQKRKDVSERRKLLNEADLVFLCLPDDAAKESVSLITNERTKVIDASTAHRTNPGWVYGLAEISEEQRREIAKAKRVANPGCHSTGFILAIYPLISANIMQKDYPLTCFSLTGYSGGGKSMIRSYEEDKTSEMFSPRLYALELSHKHLPEMMDVTGLERAPVFCPIVDDYYCGIALTISIHNNLLPSNPTAEDILEHIKDYYKNEKYVEVTPQLGKGMLESNWGAGEDNLRLTVSGNEKKTIITAQFDNLGKGAAGAAVQNMEIMLEEWK